ncbi:hypothetical protein ACEPAI_6944 [Sanghuangporus weigelae]
MPEFASQHHEQKCFIVASNALAQSYPYCIQICPSSYAKPSKQRHTSSKVSDAYWTGLCAISARMADLTCEERVEEERIMEPERLPTPCPSDVEDKSPIPRGRLETNVPASPALTALTESAGSLRLTASPSISDSSLDELEMPPTPRLRTCQLPMSPSMIISPLPLLPPLHSDSPSCSEAPICQESEFDPLDDHPLLRPLAEHWSSLDRNTTLSLAAEPPERESWPFNNALGLYVDPAMNVTTWDAGGFIRSTAPSPSPTRFRRNRRRI